MWPTISGYLDIDDIDEEYYIIRSFLNLPIFGNIILNDHLYFPDLLNIRNALQVTTPCESFKEIELLYLHSAKFGKYYVSALELFYKNKTDWIELGINTNYTKVLDADLKTHDVEVNLYLPFEAMPRVALKGGVELAEYNYKVNVSAKTANMLVSVAADLETDTINFIDIKVGLVLKSLALPHYQLTVFFKQDLSERENAMIFGFHENYEDHTFCRIESSWKIDGSNYLKFNSKASTNAFPITFLETGVTLNRSTNFVVLLDLNMDTLSKRGIAFHLNARRRGDRVLVELATPMPNLANVSMSSILRRVPQQNVYLVTGRLTRNHEIYNVNGSVEFYSDTPINLDLRLRPVSRDSVTYVEYSLHQSATSQRNINIKISGDGTFFDVNIGTTIFDKLNWSILTTIDAPPGFLSKRRDVNRCTFKTSVKQDTGDEMIGEFALITPWRQFGIDAFTANGTALLKPYGFVNLFYDFSLGHGRVLSAWQFLLMENMRASFDFRSENEAGVRTLNIGGQYANPGRTDKQLSYGGHLDVDSKMNLEANCSLLIVSKSDAGGTFAIRLPAPIDDVHRFGGKYRGDLTASSIHDVFVEARYGSDKERKRFVSQGLYRDTTDLQALVHSQWGTDTVNRTYETTLHMLRKGVRREVSVIVKTPYFVEETIRTTGYYDNNSVYQILK